MDPREPGPLAVDGVGWCIVSLGSIKKYHQLCDLKQQTYCAWSRKLGVQNQGLSKTMLPLKPVQEHFLV